jgi:hypothetical protein
MQRRAFIGILAAVGALAPSSVRAQSHDGDNNIFPGNAGLLEAPAVISHLRYAPTAYLGEIVPIEDSDRLPRVEEVIALEFERQEETFRYTHTKEKVDKLYAALQELIGPTATIHVHFAWYTGRSFRDGVNRISRYDVFPNR